MRDSELPGPIALREVCRIFGLEHSGATLLHHRSNAVYVLPRENVIARLAPNTPLRRQRAIASIDLTRWLTKHPGHIALPPLTGSQPVVTATAVATFWPLADASQKPDPADLAAVLRRLHSITVQPPELPEYQPMSRIIEALRLDAMRSAPALSPNDSSWLMRHAGQLGGQFSEVDWPLGKGLIHGDAHAENIILHNDSWKLIDWDQTCIGPREIDLISGLPDHFHTSSTRREKLYMAYGYNLLDWPSWRLLRDMAELHSLGSYIRLAPVKPAAAAELATRVRSLRENDRAARWHAVS